MLGQPLALDLVAHGRDGAGGRTDKGDALLIERLDEARAFGQKAVARMHGVGPGLFAGVDDLLGDQIAFRRLRRSDMDRLVGHFDEWRAGIGIRIDRDGGDPHAPGRLDHAAGDFAAIGDQDFLEHQGDLSLSCRAA